MTGMGLTSRNHIDPHVAAVRVSPIPCRPEDDPNVSIFGARQSFSARALMLSQPVGPMLPSALWAGCMTAPRISVVHCFNKARQRGHGQSNHGTGPKRWAQYDPHTKPRAPAASRPAFLTPILAPPTPLSTCVGVRRCCGRGSNDLPRTSARAWPLLHQSALLTWKPGTLPSALSTDETAPPGGRSVSRFHGSNPRSNRASR